MIAGHSVVSTERNRALCVRFHGGHTLQQSSAALSGSETPGEARAGTELGSRKKKDDGGALIAAEGSHFILLKAFYKCKDTLAERRHGKGTATTVKP